MKKETKKLIAAGIVMALGCGAWGSVSAADPNAAIAGEDKNVNSIYSDGKINASYGLKAEGDPSSPKEGKISLTTAKVEIQATGVGIQARNWGSVIVGDTDAQDVSISGVSQGVKLSKGGYAEITGEQVKISNEKKGILIGEQSAENIKIKIGSAVEVRDPKEMEVRGRDVGAGMPKSIMVDSNDIAKAIEFPLKRIISAIKTVLEKTPPELSADIIDRGMVMSGGTAKLRNLDKLFSRATGVPCHVADDPLLCVVKGTGIALELLASGERKFSFNKEFRR